MNKRYADILEQYRINCTKYYPGLLNRLETVIKHLEQSALTLRNNGLMTASHVKPYLAFHTELTNLLKASQKPASVEAYESLVDEFRNLYFSYSEPSIFDGIRGMDRRRFTWALIDERGTLHQPPLKAPLADWIIWAGLGSMVLISLGIAYFNS